MRSPGFTLLEVMIALTIIALAVTAILGSQAQSLSLASEAKFGTTGALLAQKKLVETLMENRFDLPSDSGDFGEEFPDYFWEIATEDYSPEEIKVPKGLKKITVTVRWGENHFFTYSLNSLHLVKEGK